MRNPLRFLLPFGLVKATQLYQQLRTLGLPAGRAARLAIDPQTPFRLHRLSFDLLPPGRLAHLECVVDVGANHGEWSHDLLFFCQPRRLLLVEPDPGLGDALAARFAGVPGFTLHRSAVGEREATLDFHLMEGAHMNSFLLPQPDVAAVYGSEFSVTRTVPVPVQPLDALTADIPKIDLLKIDVQGYEQHVLRGATDTLRRTGAVLLEVNFVSHYKGDLLFHELDRLMNDHGFALSGYSTPVRSEHLAMWGDALYLRRAPAGTAPE